MFPLLLNIFEITFKPLRHTTDSTININGNDNQFIISCWYTIKELASFFVILAKIAPPPYINIMGDIFLDIFLHTKHNGVLETGYQYFRIFCSRLKDIPTKWMEVILALFVFKICKNFIQMIQSDQSIFLSTSPISGPAYWFISTISHMQNYYKLFVEEIIKIASQNTNEGAQVLFILKDIINFFKKDFDS